ncbi:MAG: hypothetical protein J6O49_03190 [Bacteroidaceae bacterium]|nr:hypothetical protein [Bacteroidaceae bacterium]
MKRLIYIIGGFLLFMVSCNSKKSPDNDNISDQDSVAVMDSMRPDMPPPPHDSGRFDGHRPPPPPDGMHPDGPPSPPPHGKGRPPHKPDNMRGFDPASEDDMDDNGMSRYMENNDEEGWD